MGRPSRYTPEIADKICQLLMDGESLLSICSAEEMPSEAAVRLWARDDWNGFAANYTRAREIGADVCFERLGHLAAEQPPRVKGFCDAGWVAWQRNRIDTEKWILARKLPKKYGDKITQEIAGANGGPLVFQVERMGKPAKAE